MQGDGYSQSDFSDTFSTAQLHYIVCEAITATEEMQNAKRRGRPGKTANDTTSQTHETDPTSQTDNSTDETRNKD